MPPSPESHDERLLPAPHLSDAELIDGLHELPILEEHVDDLFTLDVAAPFILQAGDDLLGLRVDDIPAGGVDPLGAATRVARRKILSPRTIVCACRCRDGVLRRGRLFDRLQIGDNLRDVCVAHG